MKSYTVYYRTGGTDNFKWHKAFPVDSEIKAAEMRDKVERQGYLAYYAETSRIDAVGLPETYSPTEVSKQ